MALPPATRSLAGTGQKNQALSLLDRDSGLRLLLWKNRAEPEAPLSRTSGSIWGKGGESSLNTWWRPGPVCLLHSQHPLLLTVALQLMEPHEHIIDVKTEARRASKPHMVTESMFPWPPAEGSCGLWWALWAQD